MVRNLGQVSLTSGVEKGQEVCLALSICSACGKEETQKWAEKQQKGEETAFSPLLPGYRAGLCFPDSPAPWCNYVTEF